MKEIQFKTETQTDLQHPLENINASCRNLTGTEQRLLKSEDIYYIMHYEIPARYYVSNVLNSMEYQVFDSSDTVAVNVKFDIADPSAGYFFYLDGEGPEEIKSNAYVVLRICEEVNKKISHWIGDSRRRRCKVMMKASVNRVMQLHNSGIPMAFISPDRLVQNPVEIKRRRMHFRMELDKYVRTVGFGYYQIRCTGVNRDTEADGKVFYILYGKPNKKSEQLLKIIATEFGKKYSQETVGFRDLNGRTCVIFNVTDDSHSGDGEPEYHTEDLVVSGVYAPIERFAGAQISLRRRNAFINYCNACWDEESQTYRFDHRYDNYFRTGIA